MSKTRYTNRHDGPIAGIPAHGQGEAESDNPTVRLAVKAGKLVPADGSATTESAAPKAADLTAQITAQQHEITQRDLVIHQLQERVSELEKSQGDLTRENANLQSQKRAR